MSSIGVPCAAGTSQRYHSWDQGSNPDKAIFCCFYFKFRLVHTKTSNHGFASGYSTIQDDPHPMS